MSEHKIIKKEFIYPNKNSPKKQWRYTYHCLICDRVASKWYRKDTFTGLCSHCSKGGYDTDKFIAKSKEYHGDKYDYSKSIYVNKRTKIEIVCPIHGSFYPRAGDHMQKRGGGCQQCSLDSRSIAYTIPISIWKKRLASKHSHITLLSNQTGYHTKALFNCQTHGEFEAYLGDITNHRYLCPTCYKELDHQKQSIRPNLLDKQAQLYYVYIPSLDMYKLGVTTQKLSRRLVGMEFTVILTVSYFYTEAIEIEYYLHKSLLNYRYKGEKKLLKDGSTELYTVNVKDIILTLLGPYKSDPIRDAI